MEFTTLAVLLSEEKEPRGEEAVEEIDAVPMMKNPRNKESKTWIQNLSREH